MLRNIISVNKIAITGITGFVGLNLSKSLKSNKSIKVFGITRTPDELNKYNLNYEKILTANHNFETYIHLAGKAHDTDYKTKREDFIEVNTKLTERVFDYFLNDPKAQNFIFISSIAAAAKNSEIPIDENCEAEPYGYYGESKYLAENYILDNLPESEGKKVFILRPPMIHGPGNKGNLNLLFKIIEKGIPWPLGSFNNKRSFLSIDNFCYVIKEILNNNISQGVYNLADDEPLSTNQVVEMISEQLGRKPKILNFPKPIIQFGAKLGNKLPLPLNEERLQKLTENFLVSNKKIVSEIGKSLPISAKEGMRKTIQSLIEEHG